MTAQPIRRHLSLALAGLAVALTVGACSAGAGSGAPSAPPASNPPVATPRPSQPAQPTPEPSEDPGSDAMPITVDLVTADRHDVRVDIVDHSGRLVGARSGR